MLLGRHEHALQEMGRCELRAEKASGRLHDHDGTGASAGTDAHKHPCINSSRVACPSLVRPAHASAFPPGVCASKSGLHCHPSSSEDRFSDWDATSWAVT